VVEEIGFVFSTLGVDLEERSEEIEVKSPAIKIIGSMENTNLPQLHFLCL
jgi:hypothetical protein